MKKNVWTKNGCKYVSVVYGHDCVTHWELRLAAAVKNYKSDSPKMGLPVPELCLPLALTLPTLCFLFSFQFRLSGA